MTSLLDLPTNINTLVQNTEKDTAQFLQQTEQDVYNFAQNTERDIAKLGDNLVSNAGYTIRYGAKNVVGLVDNQGDHFFQLLQDARADISNTIQLLAILGAAGLAAFFILYGDKLFKSGFRLGEITLF